MVKHIIVWKLKDDLRDKEAKKREIKEALEGLRGKILGMTEMNIIIDGLSSSSGDLMMDSTFETKEALAAYQKHFLHIEVANKYVRPAVDVRLSYDYEL